MLGCMAMPALSATGHVCVGYLVIKRETLPGLSGLGVLPAEIVSISGCLCDHLPSLTVMEDPDAVSQSFCLPRGVAALVSALVLGSVREGAMAYPPVCRTRPLAERLLAMVSSRCAAELIGFGLQRSDAARYMCWCERRWQQRPSLADLLSERRAFTAGDITLGFEPATVSGTGEVGCSWLCSDAPSQFLDRTGVKPNRWGLISRHSDARRCCDMLDSGEIRGEPGPWFPWLLCRYSRRVGKWDRGRDWRGPKQRRRCQSG